MARETSTNDTSRLETAILKRLREAPEQCWAAVGLTGGPRVVCVGVQSGMTRQDFNTFATQAISGFRLWYDAIVPYSVAQQQFPDACRQWEQWYFREKA